MRGGPREFDPGFTCPDLLRYQRGSRTSFAYGAITLYGRAFQPDSATRAVCNSFGRAAARPRPALQPHPRNARRLSRNRFGLSPLSLATTQGIENFFLFLRVLRCVSSPGSLLAPYVFRCGYRGLSPLWVSPFGDPCFIARLRLHTAYRSLPRPSPASGAKASTIRPYYLNSSFGFALCSFQRPDAYALAGVRVAPIQSPKALKTE